MFIYSWFWDKKIKKKGTVIKIYSGDSADIVIDNKIYNFKLNKYSAPPMDHPNLTVKKKGHLAQQYLANLILNKNINCIFYKKNEYELVGDIFVNHNSITQMMKDRK